MVGTGSLSSQWSKVNRWVELTNYLSDTYGITKISAPHDFKNRELCGYVVSRCYVPEEDGITKDQKRQLLSIIDHLQLDHYDEQTTKLYNSQGAVSLAMGRAFDVEVSAASFTFDGKYETDSITAILKENSKKDRTCTIPNLFDKDNVKIAYLVPCSESRKHKASDDPMWNHEMMEAYCKQIGHDANRCSANEGEKISYLKFHGSKLAEMNGWVYDENKTKLNHDNYHQRVIFRSAHFKDDCYLSIDFEKEDFHYELHDHNGKHKREINWHGEKTDNRDSSGKHDLRMKKKRS